MNAASVSKQLLNRDCLAHSIVVCSVFQMNPRQRSFMRSFEQTISDRTAGHEF
jgi:hypothetical protein